MALQTPGNLKPDIGDPVATVETPAVIVNLDVFERNIRRYAETAKEEGVRLRSHIKTHKTPDIAHRQDDRSDGGGICCQTLGEVEVMAQSGLDDIYLSYMVVEDTKLDRVCWLSEKLDRFVLTVDSEANVAPLQEAAAAHDTTIEVVVELDVGLGRVGVRSPEAAVELATYVTNQPSLEFAGVMAFEGHVPFNPETDSEADFEQRCLDAMDRVEACVEAIEDAGHDVREVKAGSTATSLYSATHPVVTEINPGMYPFNDIHTVKSSPDIDTADISVTVHTSVIATPAADRVIVDAGSKSIALELDVDPVESTHAELVYANASEEHGWIDSTEYTDDTIDVGDRLAFYPPHVCPTINLHDTIVGVRDGIVEEVWAVQARGKVK